MLTGAVEASDTATGSRGVHTIKKGVDHPRTQAGSAPEALRIGGKASGPIETSASRK